VRLVSYRPAGTDADDAVSVGVVVGPGPLGPLTRIVPLAALADPSLGGVALDPALAACDMRGLLRGDPGLALTRAAAAAMSQRGSDPGALALAGVRLAAPVPDPGKIVCAGLNYLDHIREQSIEAPERPMLFAKFANAVVADGEPVVRHGHTHALDLEVELAVVVGRRMRRVAAADALGHVAGYTVANDISARDLQGSKPALREGERGDGQWLRAKGSDTFCPLGPVLVTPDEVGSTGDLALRSWRVPAAGPEAGTAVAMQAGSTADMLFGVAEFLAAVSEVITLEPGDVVLTGTPSGVGVFRVPPVFLEPGDVAIVEVAGIGRLVNPIVDADGDAPAGSPAARLLAGEWQPGA
jgi:2-keto-4-pentenoate hydratase/2-oxohepta-3-ene-1,7-dioic acid hydratase in catechol pathway